MRLTDDKGLRDGEALEIEKEDVLLDLGPVSVGGGGREGSVLLRVASLWHGGQVRLEGWERGTGYVDRMQGGWTDGLMGPMD